MSRSSRSQFEPITLGWHDGLQASLSSFGARLCALHVPTRHGRANVVLSYHSPAAYRQDRHFMGCTIGRNCNRIAGARFAIDGDAYTLKPNNGPHQLHGGARGFHVQRWRVLAIETGARQRAIFTYRSADGEEGYPGTVEARVIFEVEVDALNVILEAQTDRTTPVNMTLHPYFNLAGNPSCTIHDHELTIAAQKFLPVDKFMIPLGVLATVQGTPFDFRSPVRLGERLGMDHPQLALASGFDHNFVLDRDADFAAELSARASGVKMRVRTNQSGLQLYCGNHLSGADGHGWDRFCGVCLEPQNFPNAINQLEFPSPLLRPGETYRNAIRYEFSI